MLSHQAVSNLKKKSNQIFLDEHHLDYETVQSFATPRRLAVKVTAIPEKNKRMLKKK